MNATQLAKLKAQQAKTARLIADAEASNAEAERIARTPAKRKHTLTITRFVNVYHGKKNVVRKVYDTAAEARAATPQRTATVIAMPVKFVVSYEA